MSGRDSAIRARVDRRAARQDRARRAAELKAPPPTWSFTFGRAVKWMVALVAVAAVYSVLR